MAHGDKNTETKNPLKKDKFCRECVEGDAFRKAVQGRRQSPTNGGTFKFDPSAVDLRK